MSTPTDKSDWLLSDSQEIADFIENSNFPWDIRLVYEIDSTQSAILSLPPEQLQVGLVLAADVQSSGLGRSNGRIWQADPNDGLLMSFVLPVPAEVSVPVLAGVASMYVLQAGNPDISLKWPNDVVVHNQDGLFKIGGMIANVVGDKVVVGIGINLRMQPESRPTENARGLEDFGIRFGRDDLMIQYLAAIEKMLKFPKELVMSMYQASCSTLGKEISATTVTGTTLVGVATAVDETGAIVLETNGEKILLSAVDVEYLR